MNEKEKKKVDIDTNPKRGRAPHKPTRPHKDSKKYDRRRDKKEVEREVEKEEG